MFKLGLCIPLPLMFNGTYLLQPKAFLFIESWSTILTAPLHLYFFVNLVLQRQIYQVPSML